MAKVNTKSPKSSKKPADSPKKKSAKANKSKVNKPALQKIAGLFLVFSAVLFFISFTSYLFNWHIDFDKVQNYQHSFWSLLTDGDVEVGNAMGRLGAYVSYIFITRWFGIVSYLFPVLFFVVGVRMLLHIRIWHLGKFLVFLLLSLIYFPVLLAFIFPENPGFGMGGVVGVEASKWLASLLGKLGEGFLLFFLLLTFLTLKYNIPFRWAGPLKKWLSRQAEKQEEKRKEREENRDAKREPRGDIYNPGEYSVDTDDEEDELPANKPKPKPVETPIEPDEDIVTENENVPPIVEDTPKPAEKPKPAAEPAADANDPGTTINFDAPPQDAKPKPKPSAEPEFEISQPEEKPEEKAGHEDDVPEVKPDASADKGLEHSGIDEPYDPRKDLPDFRFPDYTLLEPHGSDSTEKVQTEELEANKNRIVETLNNYSIKIQKIKATIGPTVTLYEIVPAPGVRISKIKNLEDDIALSLAALGIRIIAPIPGRGTIGIEVPNSKPEIVSMRSVVNSEKFRNSKHALPIVLGKTISNDIFTFDLAKMPHLLMAGATGQGKSVGLNAIITSLLYRCHPAELKFIMVDPKKVELTLFSKIERHYLAKLPDSEEAIITDTSKVVKTLKSLVIEMDNRYELLKDAQVRNIKEYNPKFLARKLNPLEGHRFMPYIVLIVDEFADLIMTAGKDVEGPIARLAQLARAVGIHLVIATQRPSVNIITGTIKANFPARLAFRVTSKIDSRTILDAGGAEQLIGRGDMLLSTGNDLIRMQCAFVDTPEVDAITDFIGVQRAYPEAMALPEVEDEEGGGKPEFEVEDRDALFEDAAHIIVQTQQGSTSLLQRKLKLGYNRAGRIIDQLEAAGIVGPFEGSKAREVKVANEMALEQFLKDLNNKEPNNDL